MRDLFVFATVFGSIPFILMHPYVGILVWTWLGLMNPHRFGWGPAYGFPFALLVAAATFAGLFLTRDERRWKPAPEIHLLILLIVWMNVTTFFALEPVNAIAQWQRVMKIQVMGIVTLFVLNSRRHVELMVWVLALSVGYFGIKGGAFTLATGGSYRVWGPPDTFIEDNNALALAVVMVIPLLYYLFLQTRRWWLKSGLLLAMLLCALSALGSQSRGGLVAIATMSTVLWLRSRNKIVLGITLVVVALLLVGFMPGQWHERMRSILEYQADESSQGRLHAWTMLFRIANDRFFGAGFEPYTPEIYAKYMPEWPLVHAAHSIYFQFLGEHGWVGLVLFLLMWGFALRTAGRIKGATRGRRDLHWAHSLTSMIEVSLVGYFTGGAFQNLGYWDFPYYLLVLLVVIRELGRRRRISQGHTNPHEPRGDSGVDPGTAVSPAGEDGRLYLVRGQDEPRTRDSREELRGLADGMGLSDP